MKFRDLVSIMFRDVLRINLRDVRIKFRDVTIKFRDVVRIEFSYSTENH